MLISIIVLTVITGISAYIYNQYNNWLETYESSKEER